MCLQVQIKTNQCATSANGVCVCGLIVRNGNLAYTFDICDDVTVEGITWKTEDENDQFFQSFDGTVMMCLQNENYVDTAVLICVLLGQLVKN